jgi:hypothetical protein
MPPKRAKKTQTQTQNTTTTTLANVAGLLPERLNANSHLSLALVNRNTKTAIRPRDGKRRMTLQRLLGNRSDEFGDKLRAIIVRKPDAMRAGPARFPINKTPFTLVLEDMYETFGRTRIVLTLFKPEDQNPDEYEQLWSYEILIPPKGWGNSATQVKLHYRNIMFDDEPVKNLPLEIMLLVHRMYSAERSRTKFPPIKKLEVDCKYIDLTPFHARAKVWTQEFVAMLKQIGIGTWPLEVEIEGKQVWGPMFEPGAFDEVFNGFIDTGLHFAVDEDGNIEV